MLAMDMPNNSWADTHARMLVFMENHMVKTLK
jgi:hypothetical protein